MKYSVALTSKINFQLLDHLLRKDHQEDLCFGIWYKSTGKNRSSGLIYEIILPKEGERNVHGNASFNSEYFSRVIDVALEKEAGIVFFHSHFTPGWQDMSIPDIEAELRMAPSVKAATGFPLIGMTLGTDGSWSARVWIKEKGKYVRKWCCTVRVVGSDLGVTFADHLLPLPVFKEEFKRTKSAWGEEAQAKIMRLTVGIVGLGSVGSVVAEGLARMGVSKIKLIDFDTIKKHNLDRHIHASPKDIGYFKTKVVEDRLKEIATSKNFIVDTYEYGVTESDGFMAALDCDILFSCVDRPWPRQVLNTIAYWHLIPVVDGGISVRLGKKNKLCGADWKSHVVGPEHRCLECLEQYLTSDVSIERDGSFDDPVYIESLEKDHHIRRNENVIAFSLNLGSLQLMHAVSMIINPLGIGDPGEFNFHFVGGTLDKEQGLVCGEYCLTHPLISHGDKASSEYVVTGKHQLAEDMRKKAKKKRQKNNLFKYFK